MRQSWRCWLGKLWPTIAGCCGSQNGQSTKLRCVEAHGHLRLQLLPSPANLTMLAEEIASLFTSIPERERMRHSRSSTTFTFPITSRHQRRRRRRSIRYLAHGLWILTKKETSPLLRWRVETRRSASMRNYLRYKMQTSFNWRCFSSCSLFLSLSLSKILHYIESFSSERSYVNF